MGLETEIQNLHSVMKKDGRITPFTKEKIDNAIYECFMAVAASEEVEEDAEKMGEESASLGNLVVKNLYAKKQFGTFPISKTNVPHVEDIHTTVVETLKEVGKTKEARAYQRYHDQRLIDSEQIKVAKEKAGQSLTDKALFVVSESRDEIFDFDRRRIALSLMKEASIEEAQAYSVAKEAEKRIRSWADMRIASSRNGEIKIKTHKIREMVNEVMEDFSLESRLRNTHLLSIPVYDYEQALTGKNKENANVVANNPEAIFAFAGEATSKEYMLNCVFSPDVADAHLEGKIHLHDLGYGPRVYCSSHSPANIIKWGLELLNLSSSSSPAKHTHTLTGHLNTFLASMQAYYAGALGVAYINDLYAPFLASDIEQMKKNKREFLDKVQGEIGNKLAEMVEGGANADEVEWFEKKMEGVFENMRKTDLVDDEEIDKFLKQEAQYLIFSGSQNAFSRGGQTLFLDFNIHTGTPAQIRGNPALGPGGKYYMKKDDKLVALEERVRQEGEHLLSELYFAGRKVMDEEIKEAEGKVFLRRKYSTGKDERIMRIGDYEEISQRFAKALLDVWGAGDSRGGVFAFPKCDLHIDAKTFKDPKQKALLEYACQIASENGSPYFIFDRQATSLSACCRLRTVIDNDYMIKHLESLRFCGAKNVSGNWPQAAYRAGKGNREGFINNLKEWIDLAIKAHLQKKEFIKKIGQEGGAQYQTQKPWMDGRPYVDLDKATYILGIIGANEAYQYLYGKEFHEDSEIINTALEDLAELYAYKEKRAKETGLKLSFEETPAESTAGRLARLDFRKYKEARNIVKGDKETGKVYYTNSIHLRADALISLTDRIRMQSPFHQLIESGAILHGFVGEFRPPAESIYNLVYKTWINTEAAQLTISPEFTHCNDCGVISPGYKLKEKVKEEVIQNV